MYTFNRVRLRLPTRRGDLVDAPPFAHRSQAFVYEFGPPVAVYFLRASEFREQCSVDCVGNHRRVLGRNRDRNDLAGKDVNHG